jgi:hypothetical protein
MSDSRDEQAPVTGADAGAPEPAGRGRMPRPLTIAAVAVAVVLIVVGAAVVRSRDGGKPGGGTPGAQPSSQLVEQPSDVGEPADPRTRFPNPDMPLGPDGLPLVDGLVTSGPRYEQGARLLAALIAVVPPGFTVPATDSVPLGPDPAGQARSSDADRFARTHRTTWLEKAAGMDVWVSTASLAVSAGPDTGMLVALLITPGAPTMDKAICTQLGAEPRGSCQLVDVGGREVILLTVTDKRLSMQRAVSTHPDGTMVSIMQVLDSVGDGKNALPQPVFSTQQLVELAAGDRFHVN